MLLVRLCGVLLLAGGFLLYFRTFKIGLSALQRFLWATFSGAAMLFGTFIFAFGWPDTFVMTLLAGLSIFTGLGAFLYHFSGILLDHTLRGYVKRADKQRRTPTSLTNSRSKRSHLTRKHAEEQINMTNGEEEEN